MNDSPYKIMQAKGNRYGTHYISAMFLLSLDACKPFYQFMRLPRSFSEDAFKIIRRSLESWRYGMSYAEEERFLLQFFIHYSDKFGDTATYELSDWVMAADLEDLPENSEAYFLYQIVLPNIQYKKRFEGWKGSIPLRLERYFNFYNLTDPVDNPTEEGLLSEQLHTAWDVWMFNQNHDWEGTKDWHPNASASVYADNICSRIAWQNAFHRPTATAEEFAQARGWIVLNTDDKERANRIPDLSTVKLPERLVKEYIAQKLIV